MGPPQFSWNDQPVVPRSRKSFALLFCLALRPDGVSRSELAELLWKPDRSGSVRQALYELRKLPGADLWLGTDDPVQLRVETDVQDLELALDRERYDDALRLWPATVVAPIELERVWQDMRLENCNAFTEWLELERVRVSALYLDCLRCRALELEQGGANASALALARALLAHDDLNESIHRLVMRLELRCGRPEAALDQYAACRRVLSEELGVEPLGETRALLADVERRLAALRPVDAGAAPAGATPAVVTAVPGTSGHGAPAMPTPRAGAAPDTTLESRSTKRWAEHAGSIAARATTFVGRAQELDDIRRILNDPGCRLLSVTGPGGIGKTRLVLEAASVIAQTGEAVRFVSLAPVGSAELIVSAIAEELGLTFGDLEDARGQLLRALKGQRVLLVLDNFEHLVTGVDLLMEILAGAPGVTLLVTSRERLNVTPEWLLELRGLRYPDGPMAAGASDDGAEALRLFSQCARRVRRAFRLGPETTPHVLRICRLLQGVPLALELAAAWTRVLPCEAIADELEADFELLRGQHRDIEPRHRSMRMVFEGSWQRLTVAERQAFARLTVFRGGFDRRGAKDVADVPLHLLLALMDKSLLSSGDPGRFEMLEVVRQYGIEKLGETPELMERTARAHCHHYTAFLDDNQAALEGDGAKAALTIVTEELGNVRAAWSYAVEVGWAPELSRATKGLSTYYDLRGLFDEGAEAFAVAARGISRAEPDGVSAQPTLARIWLRESWFRFRLGRYSEARGLLEQSLATFTRLADPLGVASCLYQLGNVAEALGAYDESKRLLRQGLAAYRRAGHRPGVVRVLNSLGLLAYARGDYEEARRLHAEGLPEREQQGDPRALTIGLNNLGDATLRLGDHQEAARLYGRALALSRDIGDTWGVALSRCHLGDAASARHDHEAAEAHYRAGVALCEDIGLSYALAIALRGLGLTRAARGDVGEADSLLRRSLEIAAAIKASPQGHETLAALAELARRQGDLTKSLGLCAFVIEHGGRQAYAMDLSKDLVDRLRRELGEATVSAARERAASQGFEDVVLSLLARR